MNGGSKTLQFCHTMPLFSVQIWTIWTIWMGYEIMGKWNIWQVYLNFKKRKAQVKSESLLFYSTLSVNEKIKDRKNVKLEYFGYFDTETKFNIAASCFPHLWI